MAHRFVFWQNMNSMHQSAFLNALAERYEVTLVTTESESDRRGMGWEEPDLPKVNVLAFDDIDWKALIRSRRGTDDWHVFAGLQAFRKVHAAFVYSLTLNCRAGLYAEPLRMGGMVGLLKRLRGTFDGSRFGDRIGFVLCIGRESRRQFLQWGFPPGKLHSWAYVTEFREHTQKRDDSQAGVRGVFPASLIHRKGADLIVEAVERLRGIRGLSIDAYSILPGEATSWQRRLMQRAERGGVLRIHPFIGNRSLLNQMSLSDFTVLPSRFDGWGAVVNESLSVGTPVIASPYCGASELLEGRSWMGKVLEDLDPGAIARAIEEAVEIGRVDSVRRSRIAEWARSAISGERLFEHFTGIIDASDKGGEYFPAPWESPPPPLFSSRQPFHDWQHPLSHNDPMTSILHVIGSMDPELGGASQGLRSLIPLLGRIGVRNEVVCMDDPCGEVYGDDGIGIHRIGSTGNLWQYNPSLMPWLSRHAKGFDAVVIHGMWLHHGLAVSRWIKGIRRSGSGRAPLLLVMPHGMLDPWFQKAPGRRLKALRNSVYWQLVEKSVVAAADAMLFTSEEERVRAAIAFPGYPKVKERVVGFGSLTPPVCPESRMAYPFTEWPLADGEPYLLCLGRIHEKKGADLVLKAYARLRDDRLPALLIAGPGWDSDYGRSLQTAVSQDGYLYRKIHMDGMLSGVRKWEALHGCEALLLPSHHENFGVVAAEALSCGTPVLLSDKVNIHREVTSAGAGLSATDDLEGVLSLLNGWMSMQSEERQSMACAARSLFEERFHMEHCARRMLSVCRELQQEESLNAPMPAGLQPA